MSIQYINDKSFLTHNLTPTGKYFLHGKGPAVTFFRDKKVSRFNTVIFKYGDWLGRKNFENQKNV